MSRIHGTTVAALRGGAFVVTVSFLVPALLLQHLAVVLTGVGAA